MIIDRYTLVAIRYIGHNRIQQQSLVIRGKKGRCFPFDESIETSLVKDKIIFVGPLIKCGVLHPLAICGCHGSHLRT